MCCVDLSFVKILFTVLKLLPLIVYIKFFQIKKDNHIIFSITSFLHPQNTRDTVTEHESDEILKMIEQNNSVAFLLPGKKVLLFYYM